MPPFRFSLLLLLLALLSCESDAVEEQSYATDNLVAFSQLYGYVRFFHPSTAAAELDWDKFAAYGSERVAGAQTPDELAAELQRLFQPVAPSLVVGREGTVDTTSVLPLAANTDYTFWQHRGVDLGLDRNGGAYESKRVHVRGGVLRDSLFDAVPERSVLIKPLARNLVCRLQLVLPTETGEKNENSASLAELKSAMADFTFGPDSLGTRLANVIITYNVFQHFYPYFDVVEVDWPGELREALTRSLADSTRADHLTTLRRMTAPLADGHLQVRAPYAPYYPPIYWEWINDTLTVTRVADTTLPIRVGQVVTGVEGMSVEASFDSLRQTISAGTRGWRDYRSQRASLEGEKDTPITIEVEGTTDTLYRDVIPNQYYPLTKIDQPAHRSYPSGIAYVNLDLISMDDLRALFPELQRANGLIFDLRGYPNGNHELIPHLLPQADTTSAWMQIPQFVYPDREPPITYSERNWIDFMQPRQPFLGDKPVVFLTDGRAVSYAESYLGFIDNYNLATIVGQPTAGANGNVNILQLPGDIWITFTGMRVTKHDGSQLHGVGITPDVFVKRSVRGVTQGRDEILEAGLQRLRSQLLSE